MNGQPLTLLRPLLSVSRADTEAVCAEAGLRPAHDASNRSLRYARNRVRLRVLRELAVVNPDVRAAFAAFARTAAEDNDLLEQMAADAVSSCEERSPTSVSWPKSALRALPRPLLARVLERAWREMRGGGATLGQRKIEQAMHIVARGGHVALGDGGNLDVGPGPLARMSLSEDG